MALQIIGAGFGRTGTMSLIVALEQMGYTCYHMVECFPKGPKHWKHWEQIGTTTPDWDAIFEGFTATVDFPACTSYAPLAEYYTDAKVVLTCETRKSGLHPFRTQSLAKNGWNSFPALTRVLTSRRRPMTTLMAGCMITTTSSGDPGSDLQRQAGNGGCGKHLGPG